MNKRYLLLSACVIGAAIALASPVILFNPTSSPVTNRVIAYITNADTSLYVNKTNALILPGSFLTNGVTNLLIGSVPGSGIPDTDWKASNRTVVLLSSADNTTISNAIAVASNTSLTNRYAQARTNALTIVTNDFEAGRIQRAFAEVVMKELNILRTNAGMAVRTTLQLKNAMNTELNAQP